MSFKSVTDWLYDVCDTILFVLSIAVWAWHDFSGLMTFVVLGCAIVVGIRFYRRLSLRP
jgi:hypothetical protein